MPILRNLLMILAITLLANMGYADTYSIRRDNCLITVPHLYDNLVVPITRVYDEVSPHLIAALITAKNPTWDTEFDEGNGKPDYGYGLGSITLNAGKLYGLSKQDLFDPAKNVETMAKILSKAKKRKQVGNDTNNLIRWYLYGKEMTANTSTERAVVQLMRSFERYYHQPA